MAKQEVATKHDHAVANVPDYIKQGAQRGTENVQMEDIALPRLEIVQALSPELKTSDPAFIKGCVQGDLFNTLTRRLYGQSVILVPVYFQTQYLLWRDRKRGGGFRGAYDSMPEARARIEAMTADERVGWEPVETKVYVCLRVDTPQSMDAEEITLSLSRTKLKVARHWNALARMTGGDLFSRMYNVFSVDAKSDLGEYKNYNIQLIDSYWPTREVYTQAENLYTAIRTGKKRVTADMAGVDEGGSDPSQETEY